ncbi:hypothetical protein ACVQFQ_004425 [Yersinia enterocolitica]|nr:hypothetical protein [Yersinia enterocolitica]EKN5043326.1 hypothetical protein [Yersinia enterocolitica]HDL8447553.1 hypothetical protein [Yersinia enterocolitica]
MMSKELEYTRKPDGGLAEHIEVLEAFADGDADNTELLMLLIELRSLREQLAELKALLPVAVLYRSGEVLTRAECADDRTFAVCCKVEMPLFTAAKPAGESNEPM